MSFTKQLQKLSIFIKNRRKIFIILLTPLLILPIPICIDSQAAKCAYTMILMSVFWVTEALPIPVTSLIPVVLLPCFGILKSKDVAMLYFKDIVMLFFGGLVVANAIEITKLHERIALSVLMLFGSDPKWLMLGFMLTTGFLSLWISNVAATSMMLPIVEAVAKELIKNDKQHHYMQNGSTANIEPKKSESSNVLVKIQMSASDTRTLNTNADENGMLTNECKEYFDSEDFGDCETSYRSDRSRKIMAAFLISCSYSASIGGIGSLVGTAPNLLLKGYFDLKYAGIGLDFLTFMLYSLPIAIVMIFLAWGWLVIRWLPVKCGRGKVKGSNDKDSLKELIKTKFEYLGPATWGEISVGIVFILLIVLWITRDLHAVPGWKYFFKDKFITDTTPAILVVLLLFILPRENIFAGHHYNHLIEWRTLQKNFPWDIILLCGGAFAMVDGFEKSGLSDLIGLRLKELVFERKEITLIFIILVSTLATEFMSNTSIAAIFLPIIDTLAREAQINSTYLLFPFIITASLAFMLPIATPNNAIIFATGQLRMTDMITTGLVMNFIKIIVVYIASNTWLGLVFNLEFNQTLSSSMNVNNINLSNLTEFSSFSSNITTTSSATTVLF